MFALIIGILAFAGTTTSSPAPQAQTAASPLREVVFKFSYSEKSEYTSSEGDALAAPPISEGLSGGYTGTLTVDVLQVDPSDGYIKVEARDATDAENGKKPNDATFVVHPDGALTIVSGNYDSDMLTLLPYFGTQYFGPHDPLQQGMQWSDSSTYDIGNSQTIPVESTTSVASVSGDDAQIKVSTQTARVPNGSFSIDLSLLYNAAKLVPLSLDVRTTRRGFGDSSTGEHTTHFHFQRVSDTLDKS